MLMAAVILGTARSATLAAEGVICVRTSLGVLILAQKQSASAEQAQSNTSHASLKGRNYETPSWKGL